MPELSIIVPIYNVEAYLPRCIDSILAQTFTDFELILIDDGSPDRCGDIMEEYAAKDSRIVTIHQENKGVSAARNAGVRIARGTYLGFVDPDDWIEKQMYEDIIHTMKSAGAQLGICSWRDRYLDGKTRDYIADVPRIMDRAALYKEIFAIPRTVAGSNCNKVFLRERVHAFYDESLKICEDNKFLCEYCLAIDTACYLDKPYYNVFIREHSATRDNPLNVVRGLPVRRELIDIAARAGEKARQYAEADYLDTCLQYLRLTEKDKSSEAYKLTAVSFAEYMRAHFFMIIRNGEIGWKLKILMIGKVLLNIKDYYNL